MGFSMDRLEITLDSLQQSQLWLSNSLRLLADSVNTDQNERDLLVFEMREKYKVWGGTLPDWKPRSASCRQNMQHKSKT